MELLEWALLTGAFVAAGFQAGRSYGLRRKEGRPQPAPIADIYIRGLNYLLNERSDEAIDAFLEVLRQHPETAEIHLALGRLFRRRGELERAIRVHQHLLEQEGLAPAVKEEALFEMGRDYLKAGILDRAENILQQLLLQTPGNQSALLALADLYELGQDWRQAIDIRRRLLVLGDKAQGAIIAMLNCEMAEAALAEERLPEVAAALQSASAADPHSARVALIKGRLAYAKGDWGASVRAWRMLLEKPEHGEFVMVMEPLLDSLRHVGDTALRGEIMARLRSVCQAPLAVVRLSEELTKEEGIAAAQRYLREVLAVKPQLGALHALLRVGGGQSPDQFCGDIVQAIRRLDSEEEGFHCSACGFRSPNHYWKCPGCRRWGTFTLLGGEGQ